MRIAFIAHCNFLGNSAMHVFSLALELTLLGHDCAVIVPDSPETVFQHGTPNFSITDFAGALANGIPFLSGEYPDLIHTFTPRDHVRAITQSLVARYNCPYIVHMEDNEEQIVEDELSNYAFSELSSLPEDLISAVLKPWRSHPGRYQRFISAAAGFTCLIDRLLEFKPSTVPGVVFWPGYEPGFADVIHTQFDRREFGISDRELSVLYSGNTHHSNLKDMRTLYAVVTRLRQNGLPIKLVRTGWDYADIGGDIRDLSVGAVSELGFISREKMPALVASVDILIQPGKSNAFNDYRFPSKLPEYLVSGRPVILPDSNIGKVLKDGVEVLKLHNGSFLEMSNAIETLARSQSLRTLLGSNSRKFAVEHLPWSSAANILLKFYTGILSRPRSGPQLDVNSPIASHAKFSGVDPIAKNASAFPVKLIAHYLPQFHPIPENDKWWGKGFTEWANVVRAKPQFTSHNQPRLPTELGFYDLRVTEILKQQADLAREHGIFGFCFYYYWFAGKRLLERPLDLWLSDTGPDFPFCICWANENWSRRWDGSDDQILIAQEYSEHNDESFINEILPVIKDERYISIDGAPLLLIYRISELPDPIRSIDIWRRVAAENGIPNLHISAVQSFGLGDPRPFGLDSAVEFSPPHETRQLLDPKSFLGDNSNFSGHFEDYISVAMKSINYPPPDYVRFRGCFPSWDNTPRRGNKSHIFVNNSFKAYAQWLRYLVRESLYRREQQEPVVFINAWNEWAEGAILEPDEQNGRSLLEVTYAALKEGVIDHIQGTTDERERAFTGLVSEYASNAQRSGREDNS